MSTNAEIRLLNIIKEELGARIFPALEPGMAQQMAMCSQRILSYVLANLRQFPTLLNIAVDSYKELLGTLKPLLQGTEQAPLLATLETELNGRHDHEQIEALLQSICAVLAQQPQNPAAVAAVKAIIGIESRLQSAFLKACEEEVNSTPKPAANQSATSNAALTDAQVAQLQAWMRATFPGEDALEISGIKLIPGGFSKHTIFVFLNHAKTMPSTVVVRLDWVGSAIGSTVVDEYQIIKTLFEAGVRVPQPYALESSGSVLGGPFLLVSKAEGVNVGDPLEVRQGSKKIALDLAQAMAKLHSVPAAAFGNDVAGAKESTRDRLLVDIQKMEGDWRAINQTSVTMEVAFAWLKQHIELADGPRTLIHKDIGCHNFLVVDEAITVILDWETASIGNPAQDLGYAYPMVVQMSDWSEFMAAYTAAGGANTSQAQVDFYTLWGFVWTNTLAMRSRHNFLSGAINDIRKGLVGSYLFTRTEARLKEKLHALM